MITRISSGNSPAGAVFYNEKKVEKGEAERLAIRNFEGIRLPDQQLTGSMVAHKLEDRVALNERIKLPTFHVSLALAKDERVPAHDLVSIADQYMQGMGYGRQPYAIYQHHDTEHPHVHIVSVRIDETGRKISDRFEREKSNKLRQQIEKEFGLKVAETVALRPERLELKPVDYGKGDLKADISAVVQAVLTQFTFSTFAQFNQLLKFYNVQALEIPVSSQKPGQKLPNRTKPDRTRPGLKYSAIDQNGKQVGAAIKASSLPYQPTRETVERRMSAGKKIKGDRVAPLRKAATEQRDQSKNWDDFQRRLSRIGVEVIPYLSQDGNLFGIAYLDTKQRILYAGGELGKDFTAGSLKTTLGEAYQSPSVREVYQQKQEVRQSPAQRPGQERTISQQPEDPSAGHADLMRQLLYALGENGPLHDSEQDLKQMLKKARKPRLS